jgi:hypothetical protein
VLGLLPFSDERAGFPAAGLENLSLRNLLKVISVLGSCNLECVEGPKRLKASPIEIVNSAAWVLSSWPQHYFEMLTRMSSREREGKYDVRIQYAPLYDALLRKTSSEDQSDPHFLRIAFLTFVSDHWGTRVADPRLMKDIGEAVSRRYISRAELARLNQTTQRTVTRITKGKSARLPGVAEESGRVVVDRQTYAFPTPVPGKILRIREAAARIGIPVSVLRILRERAVFEVIAMGPGLPGYHERDVLRFKEQLAACAVRDSGSLSKYGSPVALSSLMRGGKLSRDEKADLVGALLTGRLSCSSPISADVRHLSVPESEVRDFVAAERKLATEIDGLEACSLLGCDFETLAALVASHYLTGTKSGGRWSILRSSAEEFSRTYMPVARLAAFMRTSSRRLEKESSIMGLSIVRLLVRPGKTRLYLRRGDADRIMDSLEPKDEGRDVSLAPWV